MKKKKSDSIMALALMLLATAVSCQNDFLQNEDEMEIRKTSETAECDTLSDLNMTGPCYVSCKAQKIVFRTEPGQDYSVTFDNGADEWISVAQTLPNRIVLEITGNTGLNIRESHISFLNLSTMAQSTVTLIQDEGISTLRRIIRQNEELDIFFSALCETHLIDSTFEYWDINYTEPGYDSTILCYKETGRTAISSASAYEREWVAFPDKRKFKHTVLAVPDSVFKKKGICSLSDLRNYAESVYGGHPELFDDMSNSENSLFKLISYHILPEEFSYNTFNLLFPEILENRQYWDEYDVEDFYETMLPHSVMRISTPFTDRDHRYVNRKGTEVIGLECPGTRIIEPSDYEWSAYNGSCFCVEDLLVYDNHTRTEVLNTRMRVMAATISPDFFEGGANRRLYYSYNEVMEHYLVRFREGFCRNVSFSGDTGPLVRYVSPSFSCFMGSSLVISLTAGRDFTVKLPAVPSDGLYEIRIGDIFGESLFNPVIQCFLKEGNNSTFTYCGTPIDMSIWTGDPEIGMVSDQEIRQNCQSDEEALAEIVKHDNELRTRGYMKSMDSYAPYGYSLRDFDNSYRKVLTTKYLKADEDYYLRIRLIGDEPYYQFLLNYIELVPESVYDGDVPEDRH